MDDRIEVTVSTPAKVGSRILVTGLQRVSSDELKCLVAAGVVVGGAPEAVGLQVDSALPPSAFDEAAFNAAVDAAAQKMARVAFDGALGQLEAELKDIIADSEKLSVEKLAAEQGVATLSSRIEQLTQQLDAERQNSADLAEKLTAAQAEIAALKARATPAAQDTPPSSAAKTAPKKGAAATPQG